MIPATRVHVWWQLLALMTIGLLELSVGYLLFIRQENRREPFNAPCRSETTLVTAHAWSTTTNYKCPNRLHKMSIETVWSWGSESPALIVFCSCSDSVPITPTARDPK